MAKPNAIILDITDELISQSIRNSSSHCMISEAVKRARPDARFVSTDLATIRFSENGKRYVFATPGIGQKTLLDFDAGDHIAPFKMRLQRPLQILKAGTRAGGVRVKGSRRTKKRAPAIGGGRGGQAAPTVLDGKAPPIGPLTDSNKVNVAIGRRRAYGLRAMATRFPEYDHAQDPERPT